MKVWMTDEKYLLFQHYEKPTASKNILHAHAQSSQSVSCKNSVHTQEILHRILNTSPMLDLSSCVAPVLTDDMLPIIRHGKMRDPRDPGSRKFLRSGRGSKQTFPCLI